MTKPSIHVAIALLFHRGKVLVGLRNANQHQGNKYEFPGGKVEAGETPVQACRREVFEEVGTGIQQWHNFDVIRHEYDDVIVHLHIFHAHVSEQYLANIQQPWTWYSREQLLELNFPKANKAIIQRLFWSHQIKISSDITELVGNGNMASATKLFYFRNEAEQFVVDQVQQLNEEDLSHLIVNVELWNQLSEEARNKVSGVHFKQSQLMDLKQSQLPVGIRCIAACHDLVSLQRAQTLGFEAVILSPVLDTLTHPEAKGLGWDKFAEYAKTIDIPVFALGGLNPDNLDIAKQHFAYGIAGIRNF